MSNRASNTLTRDEDIPRMIRWVHASLNAGIEGGPVAVDIYRPESNRSGIQNAKFHAMFADIQKTGVISMPGKRVVMADYDIDAVKALCVVWFANERELAGEPLKKPPRTITCPMTGQPITVRPSTTDFNKADTIEFIEFLYSLGADAGVRWSEPSLKSFEQYREAQSGS